MFFFITNKPFKVASNLEVDYIFKNIKIQLLVYINLSSTQLIGDLKQVFIHLKIE